MQGKRFKNIINYHLLILSKQAEEEEARRVAEENKRKEAMEFMSMNMGKLSTMGYRLDNTALSMQTTEENERRKT